MDRIMELVKERAEVMESARAKLKEKKLEEAESLTEQLKNIDTELYILRAEREDALGEGKKKQGKSLWNSAGEFFQAVYRADLKGEQADERLFKNTASGNNEATNGEGGYLVPPEYSQELIKVAMQEAVLASRVRKISVSSNLLQLPYIKESSRADGSRWGGVQAFWKSEADQYEKSKPAFGQLDIAVSKLTGLCYVTEELLEDMPAMEGIIREAFVEEFKFKIDDAILNGTGTGMPLGILNSANNALIAQAPGDTYADSVIAMWNRMMARNRNNAVWVANQDVETELLKMFMTAGTSGSLVYMPPSGLSGTPYSTLFGRPVLAAEQAAELKQQGDFMLLDLSQYALVERYAGVKQASSMHVRFDYDETAFKFTWRVGGAPLVKEAVTPYKGATTRSPYVALAARS